MLGAIYGDIAGSVYEFDNVKTKDFELMGRDCFFTDDTVMTAAVAHALMCVEDKNDEDAFKNILVGAMHVLGDAYPDAGYGGNFAYWLMTHSQKPYNSFGNGSAMRVSPVAWFAKSLDEALRFARLSAEVTHNHPEGIKGAEATAGCIYLAAHKATKEEIREFAQKYYSLDFTLDEIRECYEFNETCQESVPQAIEAFLESDSFEDAIRLTISIGGDSDTLAAICGGISEAYYGMSDAEKEAALSFLDEPMRAITEVFIKRFVDKKNK